MFLLPSAIQRPALSFAGPLQPRKQTDLIVLHHAAATQCSVDDVHKWHLNKGWLGIGYHYFVNKRGDIYAGRPEDVIGAHAEGVNHRSIGICAEGDFSLDEMPTPQGQAIAELIRWLKSRYPDATVKRHCDINNTLCPGSNYPYDEIMTEVAGQPSDPERELRILLSSGLIDSEHNPEDVVTWGELAGVLAKLARR